MEYRHLLTVIIVLSQRQESLAEPQVTVNNGKISGSFGYTRQGKQILYFRGIPYAKAPVGPLRFSNPEPAEPWTGTFYADRDPEPCPQIDEETGVIVIGNEDCLKLSVYTPKIDPDNLLPVMVYIHGGEFVRGDISSTYQGPDFLLDHDVILVAMQYRLSVFGFISTGDEIAPGNFGLKDQVLALQWVQENIQYFGGDSNRVTLFGQSAGSVSVNLHVLSNLSKGLFHQFIAQSGSALVPWGFEDSKTYKDYSFSLGRDFNCPTNTSEELINCLRNIGVNELIRDYNPFVDFRKQSAITWIPTKEPDVKGAFITDTPINLILRRKMQDLPNISGVVRDEGLVVSIFFYENSTLYDQVLGNLDALFTEISSSYFNDSHAVTLANAVKNFYVSNIDVKNKTQVLSTLTNIISDSSFLFPQILQLQLASRKLESPHYYYSFEYRGTYSKTSYILKDNMNIGITHADELIYIFPSNYSSFGVDESGLSEEDHRMIDICTELWTSFAINGVPNTSYAKEQDFWETYNDRTNTHLRIGSGSHASVTKLEHYLESRMHFWAIQLLKMIFWSG